MECMRIGARNGRWSISGVAAVNCMNQLWWGRETGKLRNRRGTLGQAW